VGRTLDMSETLTCDMHSSGVRSRKGMLFHALFVPSVSLELEDAMHLLIDHNESKVRHAERTFQVNLVHVDPLRFPLSVRDRVKIMLACCWPRPTWSTLIAKIIARNARRLVGEGRELYLWNPYTLLQYLVACEVGVHNAYHLSARYPAVPGVRRALANQVVHDIIDYPESVRVVSNQDFRFAGDERVLCFYFSKLSNELSAERGVRMLEFIGFVADKLSLPPRIFLHYSDQDSVIGDTLLESVKSRFEHLICEGPSLHRLSRNQISLSTSSTVGYEVASLLDSHFFIQQSGRSFLKMSRGLSERVARWQAEYQRFLDTDETFEIWEQRLRGFDQAAGLRVFAEHGPHPSTR